MYNMHVIGGEGGIHRCRGGLLQLDILQKLLRENRGQRQLYRREAEGLEGSQSEVLTSVLT